MITISAPLASAGNWVNNPAPGGTTINVIAGEDFLIRHELVWNETEDGAYTITVGWYNYENKPEENLTFVSASATFTSGDNNGQSIQADVILTSAPSGADTAWALVVECPVSNKDPRDGEFDVDIILGAYGVGGVPHISGNHMIPIQLGGVIVTEAMPLSWIRSAITISVTGVGVTVDITPASQSGWTNDVLDYTVTVNNTGGVADTYTLVLGDNEGWTLGIVPGSLSIGAGSSDTATLSVTVGAGSSLITVTADGVYADGNDTCIATQLTGPRVDVEVSPDWDEDLPGATLIYSVVTTNIGTVTDNITVEPSETEGWNVHFSIATINPTDDTHVCEAFPDTTEDNGASYNMYVGWENNPYGTEGWKTRAYLRFDLGIIPSGATINSATFNAKVSYGPSDGYPDYNIDNMLTDVKAVSGDSWLENELTWTTAPAVGATLDSTMVYDDNTVGAYVWYSWDVSSFVTTEYAGDGVVSLCMLSEEKELDNIDCTVWFYTKDANGNAPYLEVNYVSPYGFVVELAPGESDTRDLTVEIPLAAVPYTVNDITVTATSGVDDQVSDSETVQAHVKAVVEVDVLPIDPSWLEEYINEELNYSVTIVNTGAAPDTFEVVLTDTLGWNPTWAVADLFFSEYIEGSSYNKAIEIYNGTGAPVDLSDYQLELWSNGKTEPDGYPYVHVLSGILAHGDVWVGAHASADAAILAVADWIDPASWPSPQVINHNGDDGYTLRKISDGSVVDSIGQYDVDPGSEWDPAGAGGKDQTQVRKKTIIQGDTNFDDAFTFATEWNNYPNNTFDYIGAHPTLGPGENMTLDFSVVVPPWAITCQTNEITVTATSLTDPTGTDSESAEAHVSEPVLRAVGAWIDGPTSQETYKDPLTYVIKIRNAGLIADMYKITAYDLYGWPLYVEPQEIYLKADHSAQVALSVTIPYQTLGGTTDDITVAIEGKLASGTFTDLENASTSVEVQAIAREIYGVNLEVYPSIHQTGHPDSPLTWLVTVTNTGNMPDTYDLGIIQDVWDLVGTYPDWAGGLSQTTVELDAYEEASILLTLTVPDTEDMRTGVHNDILVWVGSQQGVYDEQDITAQVRQQMPHVPQGEIKLQAVAGYVAIDIWPTYYDFGVLNEMEERATPADYFTLRNVGNVYVDVTIVGMDATSKPGEPAAKWTLGDGFVGVDMYALWWTSGGEPVDTVTKEEKILTDELAPSDETQFDLMIQAPSTFTTPAKMWMKVAITARKLHPQP